METLFDDDGEELSFGGEFSEDDMVEAETHTCEDCGESFHLGAWSEPLPGCYLDGVGFHCGCLPATED